MKVELNRTFPLPAPAGAAWALLQDLTEVAACMPGAKITERVDENRYKGTVSVKVGPASLSFRGDIEVKGIDAAARTLRLSAKGTDTTGGSAASMDLTARIEPAGEGCNLVGESAVSMSGKAAAFGARLMMPLADQVLGQFAANFAARLQAMPVQGAPAPAAEAKSLNAFGVLWGALRNWLRSLFGGK